MPCEPPLWGMWEGTVPYVREGTTDGPQRGICDAFYSRTHVTVISPQVHLTRPLKVMVYCKLVLHFRDPLCYPHTLFLYTPHVQWLSTSRPFYSRTTLCSPALALVLLIFSSPRNGVLSAPTRKRLPSPLAAMCPSQVLRNLLLNSIK